ncbi:MAG: hypothetical protein ACRCXK_01990 [Wohlfahrtiimonas sp.]
MIIKIDLVFKGKPNNKNPINLVFGDDGGIDPGHAVNVIDSVLSFYDFSVNSSVVIDYNLNDDLVYNADQLVFNHAKRSFKPFIITFDNPIKMHQKNSVLFDSANNVLRYFLANWGVFDKISNVGKTIWHNAETIKESSKISWFKVEKNLAGGSATWQNVTVPQHIASVICWSDSPAFDRHSKNIWASAENANINKSTAWGKAQSFNAKPQVNWNVAAMPSGCGPSIRPPFVPPYIPPTGPITIIKNLIFCHKPNNENPINLVFGDECCASDSGHTIDDKKVYILKNNIEILRTDTNDKIKAFSVNISTNRQNFLWGGGLSLPFSEFEKIKDKPEIEININQYKFIVDIDNISIKKVFNSNIIELSVLSTTNQLKDINSHKIDTDMNASTIMLYQLNRDDLNTGFTFRNDSGIDWVIQSGLIEYRDASSLDIITKIASTTNDTVVSHAYKKEIIIKPKYPMTEPVYSLPSAKLFEYNVTNEESARFNAIVISGENVGVTAIVRKEGTAGERIAPMQVNRLITEEVAARRAAINAIYNTNDTSSKINVIAPLFEEAPLLYPSDLVQIDNDIGWIDDVSISAEKAGEAFVVRHTFSIEKKVV